MSAGSSRRGASGGRNTGKLDTEANSALDSQVHLTVFNNTDLDDNVSPEELQDLVDRFGEDLAAWPLEFREPAEDLIDASDEARDIISQARQLRKQLRSLGPKAPTCIVDRIVSIALDTDPPIDTVLRLRN